MAKTKVNTPNEEGTIVDEETIVDVVANATNLAIIDKLLFAIAIRTPNEFNECAVYFIKDGLEFPIGAVSAGIDTSETEVIEMAKRMVSRTLSNWAFQI